MAQKIQTLLIDDLDGSEADGTVPFALDGVGYEIDLSTGHAEQLRATMARYMDAGRKTTAARAGRNGHKSPASRINTAAVRTWARSHGFEVKDRGRIPADVIAQYQTAADK